MRGLMEQWIKKRELEEVKGADLFEALALLEKKDRGFKLKYAYDHTFALLLFAHTEYICSLLGTDEEGIKKEEKQCIHELHKYNRIKDASQKLLGVLAQKEGVTLRKIAERFGAPD